MRQNGALFVLASNGWIVMEPWRQRSPSEKRERVRHNAQTRFLAMRAGELKNDCNAVLIQNDLRVKLLGNMGNTSTHIKGNGRDTRDQLIIARHSRSTRHHPVVTISVHTSHCSTRNPKYTDKNSVITWGNNNNI